MLLAYGGVSTLRIPSMLPRIAAVTCLALVAWHVTGAQDSKSQGNCTGLHAGITAQLTQGYSEPSVMVAFHLLNDSETAQTTAPESWKIVIDGKELSDSGWIFGNGPEPVGGYGTLATGSTFDFGMALPIAKYFPGTKEYRISWKGRYFQSPTVTVRIPTSKH
jgi:hypothetical protein